MTLHKNIPLGQNHVIHNWSYATSTDRLTATGFVVGDIGKVALQSSDNTFWMLTATTPVWISVGSSPSLISAIGQASDGYQAEINYLNSQLGSVTTSVRQASDGYQSEINYINAQLGSATTSIRQASDGYANSIAILNAEATAQTEWNTSVKQACDGYATSSSLSNYVSTSMLGSAIPSLRQASDGYQSEINYLTNQLGSVTTSIRQAADGYAAVDTYLANQLGSVTTSLRQASDGYQSEINYLSDQLGSVTTSVRQASDGYANSIAILNADASQQSTWNDTVRTILDGYATSSSLSSYVSNSMLGSAIPSIRQACDGYQLSGSYVTTSMLGSAIPSIRQACDGYQLSGSYVTTSMLGSAIPSIRQACDGYQLSGSYVTTSMLGNAIPDIRAACDGYNNSIAVLNAKATAQTSWNTSVKQACDGYATTSSLSNYAYLPGTSGGQTLKGGTAASETLTLMSTAHATKGKILFGTSAYDEANNILGLRQSSPNTKSVLDIASSTQIISRIALTGQEFYAPAHTDTEGVALIVGVNRSANRQLWVGQTDCLTQNTTNSIFRIVTGGTVAGATIDAIGTDGSTGQLLTIGNTGGVNLATIVSSSTTSGKNISIGTSSFTPDNYIHIKSNRTSNDTFIKLQTTNGFVLFKTDYLASKGAIFLVDCGNTAMFAVHNTSGPCGVSIGPQLAATAGSVAQATDYHDGGGNPGALGILHVASGGSSTTATGIIFERNQSDSMPSELTIRKSQGGQSDAKSTISSSDKVGVIYFAGYTGSAWIDGAAIRVNAGTVSSTTIAPRLVIQTK
jgi:hypothetical protein